MRHSDYQTNELFFSFLGKNQVLRTIEDLISETKKNGWEIKLKLVPEDSVREDFLEISSRYNIVEDPDNFDYILPVAEIASLEEPKYKSKRKDVKKFLSLYPNHQVRLLNILDPQISENLKTLYKLWENQQKNHDEETSNEYQALCNCISYAPHFKYTAVGVYAEEKLIAFCIAEVLPNNYCMAHFAKVNYRYQGIYSYVIHQIAQKMYSQECRFMNIMQDLGIPGLRLSKQLWHPAFYLKKFKISPKD